MDGMMLEWMCRREVGDFGGARMHRGGGGGVEEMVSVWWTGVAIVRLVHT